MPCNHIRNQVTTNNPWKIQLSGWLAGCLASLMSTGQHGQGTRGIPIFCDPADRQSTVQCGRNYEHYHWLHQFTRIVTNHVSHEGIITYQWTLWACYAFFCFVKQLVYQNFCVSAVQHVQWAEVYLFTSAILSNLFSGLEPGPGFFKATGQFWGAGKR